MGDEALGRTRLQVDGVSKSFGATAALVGASLTAKAGEVHAVIGENGAGKSTLMGILSGALQPGSGAITLDGAPFQPASPLEARQAGVAIVHQELSLCPHLSVAENITLGDEPTSLGVVRSRQRDAFVRGLLDRVFGDRLAARAQPSTRVADLSSAEKQLVEIARALGSPRTRLLILDEPTSSLGAADTERLLRLVRKLRGDGLTILYISHFLEELRAIADTYTVLRDGRTVGSGDMQATTLDAIVQQMAGRNVSGPVRRAKGALGEPVLVVNGLAGLDKPQEATLTVCRGEILGIAGLVGSGRTELLRAIFGLDPIRRGSIRVGTNLGWANPRERLAQGMGFASEDRKRDGLALSRSVAENITLSSLPLVSWPATVRQKAQKQIEALGIRCHGPDQATWDLSGGNQQKVALARLLHSEVDLLLLDEPTRGIDVGSKSDIYELLGRLADRGKAILLVSSYLPELLALCDRVAVMTRGRLGPAHPIADCTEETLLREAVGA
jgi:ribose transport system ATP-binding protein